MISDPPYIREHKKAEREWQARVALVRKIINTYGYALAGAAFTQPFLEGDEFGLPNFVMTAVAVALHVGAIYIAPVNPEKSDD